MSKTIKTTDFKDLKLFKRGKVRDVYDLDDKLLVVSTDRISCFDVILPTAIPQKGEILTSLSLFWFELTKDLIENHLITGDFNEFPEELKQHKEDLAGRSMITKKAEVIPFECVVRGYLSGSGWKEYVDTRSVCGIKLPDGLQESDKLPKPIFTPSTKEDSGHDMNVSHAYLTKRIGKEMTEKLEELSIGIYQKAADYAENKGIIIADTKFEFGMYNNKIILIDEVLTPDSSRFWPKSQYEPGKGQPSFDKQYVRDYLETLDWGKTAPGPELPQEVVEETRNKYLEISALLTGAAV